MFIRVKTKPNTHRKNVQIVEAFRINGKVKQRIVRHIGVAHNQQEVEKLKNLGQWMLSQMETATQDVIFSPEEWFNLRLAGQQFKEEKQALMVDIKKLRAIKKQVVGIHDIYGKLYSQLGYDHIFKNPARQVCVSQILKNIVMARLANPKSKHATVEMLEEEFGISLSLDKVYRMMDKLDEETIERIKNITQATSKKLLNNKLEVVFFDCTTLYFESFSEDELRKLGYSKDLKFNQPQVVLSLLVSQEGLPIDYELHEGNKYEGHTLKSAVARLKAKHDIGRMVMVADAAMLNKENVSELNKLGIEYIVGARIKNVNQEVQEEILDKNGYKKLGDESEVKIISLSGKEKLIVSYRKNRAKKDKADRLKAIEKLIKKLKKSKKASSLISNYGYKKYLKIEGKSKIEIDEEKLKEAEKWDGLHGIVTNAKLSAEETLSQYRNLWQVEEAFRITKHDLRIRPVYHWKAERVRAHVGICFICYALIKNLSYRIKLRIKENISIETVRQALVRTNLTLVEDIGTNKRYCIASQLSEIGRKIYRAMEVEYSLVPFEI